MPLKKIWLKTRVKLNSKSKSLASRLTKWTGKSKEYVHPKHLVSDSGRKAWYIPYVDKDQTVLDLGCGNGIHAMKVALGGCRKIIAVDYDEKQLNIGRRLVGEKGLNNITYKQWDISKKFPFAANSFDRVLLLDVIEHLNDRRAVLCEVGRVLKDDGLLILSAPNVETSWKRKLKSVGLPYYTDPDHKIEYSLSSLLEELKSGGFVVQGEPNVIVYDTPLAGLIDLVGGISLSFYRRLINWKVRQVQRYPAETSGWRLVCSKMGLKKQDKSEKGRLE